MKENIQFLQAFLKNPGKVGPITPSSPELAAEWLAGHRPDVDNIVLELGVGTGAITKFLQDIVPNANPTSGSSSTATSSDRSTQLSRYEDHLRERCSTHMRSTRSPGLERFGTSSAACRLSRCRMRSARASSPRSTSSWTRAASCGILQYAHGYFFPPAIKLREFLKRPLRQIAPQPALVKNVPPAFTLTWSTV